MILVCGEILIDMFLRNEHLGLMNFEATPGGSPFNVALGLARLGQQVALFSALSTDMIGERLWQFLTEEKIETTYLKRNNRPSTLSLVDQSSKNPDYAFYGQGAADRDLHAADLSQLPESFDAIHFGSYACVVEPIATTLLTLAMQNKDKSVISYDPNIRLSVESDKSKWQNKLEAFSRNATILKISEEDFTSLFDVFDPEPVVKLWLERGVKLVLITRGNNGASAYWPGGMRHRPAPAIKLIDTVGAGDSFMAAILAALAKTNQLSIAALASIQPEAIDGVLDFAIAAAAVTCSRRGANLPLRSDLQQWKF